MIEEMLGPLVSWRFLNDEKYRQGHVRIINALPGVRIMGLHIPDMKKLAKGLVGRDDAMEIVAGFEREAEYGLSRRADYGDGRNKGAGMTESAEGQSLCYEEVLVWGFMLNFMKLPVEERLERVAVYVAHIDNWAVCDSFCCSAKWVEKTKASCLAGPEVMAKSSVPKTLSFRKCSQEKLWDFLSPYFESEKEFEVRFAVIMSMCCLMDERWLAKIFDKLDRLDFNVIRSEYVSAKQARDLKAREASIGGVPDDISGLCRTDCSGLQKGIALGEPPYYVRMGVAWFLATALAKFPDETRAYVAVSKLPEDVIRLYVRKARESFRTRNVSPF